MIVLCPFHSCQKRGPSIPRGNKPPLGLALLNAYLHTMLRFILCLLLLGGFYGSSFGQYAETIGSDRPGFTNSANTVGSRVVQFQVGGRFLGSEQSAQQNYGPGRHLIGGAFFATIRVGILERLEVGFPIAYQQLKDQRLNAFETTVEDLEFGISLRGNVLESNGKTPNIGLLGQVSFPERGTERYANSIFLMFMAQIQQQLERRISLSSNFGVMRHFRTDFLYTLNLSVDVSPRSTIYVEHFGTYRMDYGAASPFTQEPERVPFWYGNVNGGFAIKATSDLLIDLHAGYGSLAVGPYDSMDWFAEMGASWRFRFKKRQKKKSSSEVPAAN